MPETPAMNPAGASWPAKDHVKGCSANAVATIAIAQAAANADYPGDGSDRKPEDEAFWERVRLESNRIASWTVDGLGITGKAEQVDS